MQTSIEKSSDIFQNDEKGETFIYSSIFCVKYNFFCAEQKKK